MPIQKMPLVFADASTFTSGKSIPSLPGDVIAIEMPLAESNTLKRMDVSQTMVHFKHFIPPFYIILDNLHNPRYSSFKCKITVDRKEFVPIELTSETQLELHDMVTESKEEVSGLIKSDGIHNTKTGSATNAPLQPDRTTHAIPFHTHPAGTYEMFSINYGLPSTSDLKYLHSEPLSKNVFNAHILPSIEGIYVIAKKTCNKVPKVNLTVPQFNKVLNDCSFILLPWNFNQSWFIF